jgi:hypothetical protein
MGIWFSLCTLFRAYHFFVVFLLYPSRTNALNAMREGRVTTGFLPEVRHAGNAVPGIFSISNDSQPKKKKNISIIFRSIFAKPHFCGFLTL